jgi:endonuclease/exonuclease/phosphatase family metal-dependent hydrolase
MPYREALLVEQAQQYSAVHESFIGTAATLPGEDMPAEKVVILFWNLNKKILTQSIVRLVQTHNVQILLLAEPPEDFNPSDLLMALNTVPRPSRVKGFFAVDSAPEKHKVRVFSRLGEMRNWKLKVRRSRYAIWQVTVRSRGSFLLAPAHFPSIQNDQGDQQRETATALRLDLESAENNQADPISIVIGDLNANPFDAGIASVYGLHATHLRSSAVHRVRNQNGAAYRYLYNPMWRFFAGSQPGTFFGHTSAPVCHNWFILDQVLVRPALLNLFDDKTDVEILTNDGALPLLTSHSGRPSNNFSDHLPLLFRFNLPGD